MCGLARFHFFVIVECGLAVGAGNLQLKLHGRQCIIKACRLSKSATGTKKTRLGVFASTGVPIVVKLSVQISDTLIL